MRGIERGEGIKLAAVAGVATLLIALASCGGRQRPGTGLEPKHGHHARQQPRHHAEQQP